MKRLRIVAITTALLMMAEMPCVGFAYAGEIKVSANEAITEQANDMSAVSDDKVSFDSSETKPEDDTVFDDNASSSDTEMKPEAEQEDTNSDASDDDIPDVEVSGYEQETDIEDEDIAEEEAEVAASRFTIEDAVIMYGENGNNETGNLDGLFKPHYETEDGELTLAGREDEDTAGTFRVTYKFIIGETEVSDAGEFDAIESEDLSRIPAGTDVTVAAKAETAGLPELVATQFITIAKRELIVRLESTEDIEIDEKTVTEDDKLVIEGDDEAAGHIVIEAVENETNTGGASFERTEDTDIDADAILAGDIILDVSEVDFERNGFQEVPVEMELSDELLGNYSLTYDPKAYVYVQEASYTITFTVKNDGKTKTCTYVLDQGYLNTQRTITDVLNQLSAYDMISPDMGGFVDTERGDRIYGWRITKDAISPYGYMDYLDADFKYESEYDAEYYMLSAKSDYYLTAILFRKASDNIFIDMTPSVVYDGRAHVSYDAAESSSQANDLDMSVRYVADGADIDDYTELRYGTDYKVTYKNNKNASMTMTDDGSYESVYTEGVDDKKRPCAVITGAGNYKGFSATVYFDILPADIGDNPAAQVSGLKHSYALNSKGVISGSISPKVTWSQSIWNGKKYVTKSSTLSSGKDYTPMIYRYDSDKWVLTDITNPAKIVETGRYLYTVRGRGNYCGTVFGQTYGGVFSDGISDPMYPTVCTYVGSDVANCQFTVINDVSQDLANAVVTVRKPQVNYNSSKYYTASDFGITVTIGTGKNKVNLTEGIDYYVTFDGTDFPYVSSREKSGSSYIYNQSNSSEIYEGEKGVNARIKISNKYAVTITAIEGNDNGIFGSKKAKDVRIKGVKINPAWFKLNSPTLKYDGYDNSSAFSFIYNRKSQVQQVKPETVLTFDSDGNSNFQDVKESMSSYNGRTVFVMHSAYNKNVGVYQSTVYPVGPGVDHDYIQKTSFKRVGINTTQAFRNGLLSVTCDAADYNAGGSLPKNVHIIFNGRDNDLGDMKYNGQSTYIYDGVYPYTYVKVTLSASGNTKPGDGAGLYIQGDGTTFKGKSGKINYSVQPVTFSSLVIPTLRQDSYSKLYGKTTQTVNGGVLYAAVTPVKKTSKAPTPKITLYQTYYKNEKDYYNGMMSLAALKTDQYKLTLTQADASGNKYDVAVDNKKAKILTGIDFDGVTLDGGYTVYDAAATITGATVMYNGKEYQFPADAKVPIPFKGRQIRFDGVGNGVTSVRLKDGTVLDGDDFYVEYGDNISQGTGSFTVVLKRNAVTDQYKYGASKKFSFSISKADSIVL